MLLHTWLIKGGVLAITMPELAVASIVFCSSNWLPWKAQIKHMQRKKIPSLHSSSEEGSAGRGTQSLYPWANAQSELWPSLSVKTFVPLTI